MTDILVLGNGPAGISAAIYALRAGLRVTVIGRDMGALAKADKVENYYGFAEPITGAQLHRAGLMQAERLGAQMITGEVLSIGYEGDGFSVSTADAQFAAPVAVLATGSSRRAPRIPGLAEFEGKGVSYCAVCDAFFYKGKDVAVLGDGDYALHEAAELLPVAGSVTLLTNGKPAPQTTPDTIRVITEKITALEGDATLDAVRLADGSTVSVSGVFVALGAAGSSDLARKLGAEINGTSVVVGSDMQTAVPGLFAAGDCTGGLLQIAKAVHEGAVAGTSAVKLIRSRK